MRVDWSKVLVNLLGLCVLVFNGLLIYALSSEKDTVDGSVWMLLVSREVFGIIYFVVSFSHKYILSRMKVDHEDKGFFAFWIYIIYFIMLFGFAMGELAIMSKHPTSSSSRFPLTTFGWVFVALDMMVVFVMFFKGVYIPASSSYTSDEESDYDDEDNNNNNSGDDTNNDQQ
jgi:hypothetical protein